MQWLKVSGVVGVKALCNINSQLQYQLKMSLDDIKNDFLMKCKETRSYVILAKMYVMKSSTILILSLKEIYLFNGD